MKKIVCIMICMILFYPIFVLAEGLPKSPFTTNIRSTEQTNYMRKAFTSQSMTSTFINSFAVPTSIKTSDGAYPLYLLSKNKNTPTTANTITPGEHNPIEVNDSGIQYILNHGYHVGGDESVFDSGEYGTITTDNIKQYITQIALWLYIYQNKEKFQDSYCKDGACDFLDSSNNPVSADEVYALVNQASGFSSYTYLKYILKLVDNAKTHHSPDSELSTQSGGVLQYTIDKESNLLISELIQAIPTGNTVNFISSSVTIDDPNHYGAYLVDQNNIPISSLENVPESFRFVVSLNDKNSSMNLTSLKLHIHGYFASDKVYEYHASGDNASSLSHVVLGLSGLEDVRSTYTLQNFVKISTLDPTNSQLSGATMVLTGKGNNSFHETWVSDGSSHFLQLEDGEYTLCETKAPKGYAACEECVDFRVDGDNVTVLDMKNEQTVEVPNTGFFQSKAFKIIGILLFVFGIGIFGYHYLRNENENKA